MKHSSKKTQFRGRKRPSSRRSPRQAPRRALPPSRGYRRPSEKTAEGIFSGTKNGYGFVALESEERDVFIPREKTCGAIDGDRVALRYHTFESAGVTRTEGTVTRIVEEVRHTVIGTLCEEESRHGRKRFVRFFVDPDDTKLSLLLYVDSPGDARLGDKVEVLLPPRRAGVDALVGTLLRTFGPAASREANYAAILSDCGIPTDFSREALAEAEEVARLPLEEAGRTRRTDEIIFTIDGAGAKDLDDAVSLTRSPKGNWLLGVHIADVSTYVRPRTSLDAAAMERGTSVYFTDKVVPMLPPALSNGACSLNAGEEKYALSCLMELDATGGFLSTRIERSIIRSRVRGVYSEVNDLFAQGEQSPFFEKYREVYPTLCEMHRLYLILAEKSRKRGALELDQTEAEILLDEQGEPVDIRPRTRGDAEKLIEQFMLAANEAVATLLSEKGLPCVYRVHEAPRPEKLAEFVTFAQNLGLHVSSLTGDREPDSAAFAALLDAAREKGLGEALSYPMLRTMAKAHYSEVCHPHFGLGIEKYCHFTSPIRRLSDLATHRAIEAVLLDGEAPQKYHSYVRRAALAASETELRALNAERRIEALYKTIYLAKHLGEVYPASVTSVTRFGVFAALPNTCEGLIPLTALSGVWEFDEGNLMLRSSSGDTLRLGDRITVSVEEADIPRGKALFGLVAMGVPTPPDPTPREPSADREEARPKSRKSSGGASRPKRSPAARAKTETTARPKRPAKTEKSAESPQPKKAKDPAGSQPKRKKPSSGAGPARKPSK